MRRVPEIAGERALVILAAVVVIYIVLGVLYESTIHPITILSSLPSAGIGACWPDAVWSRSVLGGTGRRVLLMGIVKKNAIMMIDFAIDAERNQGISPPLPSSRRVCCVSVDMMTTAAALLGAMR